MSYHVKCDRCRRETTVATPRPDPPNGWQRISVLNPELRSGAARINPVICNQCDEEMRQWYRDRDVAVAS